MTDAVKGDADHLALDELRWIVVRNIVHNVNASGVTTNESNGNFIGYNEIWEPGGQGILLHGQNKTVTQAREGNQYIVGNFIHKVSSFGAAGTACLRIENGSNNVKRVWVYNNILWANTAVAGFLEIWIAASTVVMGQGKNVLVTKRVSGTWNHTPDIDTSSARTAAQAYVKSVGGVKTNAGLPVGNELRTAGTVVPQTEARTYGAFSDFRGTALHATTPCVGPCNAP